MTADSEKTDSESEQEEEQPTEEPKEDDTEEVTFKDLVSNVILRALLQYYTINNIFVAKFPEIKAILLLL